MADHKRRIQSLLGVRPPDAPAASPDARPTVPSDPSRPLRRGTPFRLSTDDPAATELPDAVQALRPELRTIAQHYLQARRRSGVALLEAARWLSEARAAAQHGEWYDFLAATATSPDTAERLCLQHPAFAEAVANGRLNQSVAERLARGSTPLTAIDAVLAFPKPPTVSEAERAIRSARQAAAPSVELAASASPASAHSSAVRSDHANPLPAPAPDMPPSEARHAETDARGDPHAALLLQAAQTLATLARTPDHLPANDETLQALATIAQAVQTIRAALIPMATERTLRHELARYAVPGAVRSDASAQRRRRRRPAKNPLHPLMCGFGPMDGIRR